VCRFLLVPHLGRHHGLRRFLPARLDHVLQRRIWRRKWGHPAYIGRYGAHREVPRELAEAVETRWFKPGGWILDIGCGGGWLSAWLAEHGYRVVGADYAAEAISRARALYGEEPGRLEWEVVDFVKSPPGRRGFDSLLDRACLGHIDPPLWPGYGRVIEACAGPEARFLLVVGPSTTHAKARELAMRAREVLGRFEQERAEETVIRRALADGSQEELRPAIALWLRSRA
jgi:SAM-dependent methyltransferase